MFPPGSRVVVGKRPRETLFKRVAGDYDYLHLATAGSFSRNAPSLSALELEPDEENDGRRVARDRRYEAARCALVTLAACETALGKAISRTPAGMSLWG
jgi:CHAT domain-containing protein